ncbi:MAG: membrane integrity-associated transporter subunit PqiC [Planctomycetes bacterium]|nr:membrane integrity-associated transporter subunit PqiC [Planctomycetota bacterium]
MSRFPFLFALTAVGALAACGSVELPREHFYRLDLPVARRPDPGRAGVLRVQDLQLGTALDGDCLSVQRGVEVEPRPFDRWIAPLDRLVTDALVLSLSRARVCDLVKGAADAGAEHWTLHGRIVEFGEARGADGAAEARIALELWLEQHGELVFHDEFRIAEPLANGGPEATVAGLSQGLVRVVDDVVARMQARGLFAAARPPAAAPR